MQIVVPPPAIAVWIFVGVPLLVLLVGLAIPGKPLLVRLAPFGVVAIVFAAVWNLAGRPLRFAWDERGIRDGTFGPERRIAWSDVREARLVRAYRRTEFRPVRRTHGTYYSGYCSGTWELADGRRVRVFLEPVSEDALLVTTADGTTCLYSPRSFDRFLAAATSAGAGSTRASP